MKKIAIAACLISAALAVPAAVSADTIRLKNGNIFEGKVESKTDKEIRVTLDGTVLVFRPEEVVSITPGEVPTSPFSSSATPGKKRGGAFEAFQKKIGQQRKAGRRRTAGAAKSGPESTLPTLDFSKAWWWPKGKTAQKIGEKATAISEAGVPVLAGALFVIIFHLVCIYGVAKKTGTGHAWLAFVPVLNLVLICWMGGMPSWWLIPLFLADGFHPLVALAGNAIFFFGFVGPGIARALRKPWWVGPVFFLYPLAVLVWAYFAFAPDKKKPKVELPPGFKLPS